MTAKTAIAKTAISKTANARIAKAPTAPAVASIRAKCRRAATESLPIPKNATTAKPTATTHRAQNRAQKQNAATALSKRIWAKNAIWAQTKTAFRAIPAHTDSAENPVVRPIARKRRPIAATAKYKNRQARNATTATTMLITAARRNAHTVRIAATAKCKKNTANRATWAPQTADARHIAQTSSTDAMPAESRHLRPSP